MKVESFFKLIYDLMTPLLATLLAMTGVGCYLTFVTLLFDSLGYDKITIGYIQASYFFGLMIGAWKIEDLVRKIGQIQTLAATGSILTSMTLIQALTTSLPVWIITRMFAGISLSAFYVVIECWMFDHSTPKKRGILISLYMFMLYGGYTLGQQLLKTLQIDGYQVYIITSILYSFSVLTVALSTKKLTLPDTDEYIKLKSIFLTSPMGTTGCLISGLALGSLFSFLPITSTLFKIKPETLTTTLMAGGVLSQLPLGKLSDHFDRRIVLFGLSIVLNLLLFLILLPFTRTTQLTYLLIFLLGSGFFALYPISLSHVIDHLKPGKYTAGTATLLIIYSIGSFSGPIISSYVIDQANAYGLFIFLLILVSCQTAVGVYSLKTRKSVPEENQEDFIAIPGTTSTIVELDPRGPE